MKKSIQKTIDETIASIKSSGVHGAISSLNKKLTNPALTTELKSMVDEVGLRFARKTSINLNEQRRNARTKGFGNTAQWQKMIQDLLHSFIVQMSFSIFETTKETLIRVLNQSIAEGWGVDKTVQALEDLNLADYQAARIVRTEITRASNAGIQVASQTFPFEQTKEWMATHDDKTRHAHMDLDGVTINEEDVFIDDDGNELMFPGDPTAAAETTVNCRCTMAMVAKVNERGRLIPKQNVAA